MRLYWDFCSILGWGGCLIIGKAGLLIGEMPEKLGMMSTAGRICRKPLA
jgi:hypothetical protein